MSLNIGNDGIDAVKELRNNPHFQALHASLLEAVRSFTNRALDMPADHQRHDAIGYARALRDVYIAFENAATGTPYQRVEKPSPVERGKR